MKIMKILLTTISLLSMGSIWGQVDTATSLAKEKINYLQEEIDIVTKEWKEANEKGGNLINFQGKKWEKVRTDKKYILDSLIARKVRLEESLKLKIDTVIVFIKAKEVPSDGARSSWYSALNYKRFGDRKFNVWYNWKEKSFMIPYPVQTGDMKEKKSFTKAILILPLQYILDSMTIDARLTIDINYGKIPHIIKILTTGKGRYLKIEEIVTIIGQPGQESLRSSIIPSHIRGILLKRLKEKIADGSVEPNLFE